MPKVKVRIINKSNNPLPEYATEGSAGMDLRAFIEEDMVIPPGDRVMVPTGIFIELPEGFEAQVRPRSGLAIKQGITCLNSPGTIDSDYRGEIHAILINLSKEEQRIHPGDRVAQLVVHKYERVKWKQVDKMSETKRGEGGFGHTGKK